MAYLLYQPCDKHFKIKKSIIEMDIELKSSHFSQLKKARQGTVEIGIIETFDNNVLIIIKNNCYGYTCLHKPLDV